MVMSSDTVPVATTLPEIYTPDAIPSQTERWQNLLSVFSDTFSHAPEFVARSPGRVNIIGEHIDYSLYSVLPMAITADALVAVSFTVPSKKTASSDHFKLCIANVQCEKFPTRGYDIPGEGIVDIDAKVHEWTNYFKCGLKGALESLRSKYGKDFKPTSMNVLMDGSVPAGGGLSSSAAFVSASALAVLVANGEKNIDKTMLTELAIVSERAVGVNSGGMDQSASVFAQRGSALYVSFLPTLTARPITFPKTEPELSFLIAQSFVAADKHVTGPICYNLRVVECTLAAAYLHASLNKHKQLPDDSSPLKQSLRTFQETYFSTKPQSLDPKEELTEMITKAKETLAKTEGYTRKEIAEGLGLTIEELAERYESIFPIRAERFMLRQRALHVFEEAKRVLEFMEILEKSGSSASNNIGESLGRLMNATQDSCRELYECSCPELDMICAIARDAGALGSRLTGAGWGGCSVHLVPVDKLQVVMDTLESQYYSKMRGGTRDGAMVVSRPGGGSAVLWVVDGKLV